MSSFLDRLKKKDILPSTPEDTKKTQVAAQVTQSVAANPPNPPAAEQLKVDIFQTANAIVIYSQIAGAGVDDYAVTIDGEGDVITIKGERKRPTGEHFEHPDIEGKEHVLAECAWGKFYRQIILPAEVDATKTQARMRDGVLMLVLPLKEVRGGGVRIEVQKV